MPEQARKLVALDLGAESGRAVVGLLREDRLTLAEVHRFPNGPIRIPAGAGGDPLYWDILRLWSEIKRGLTLCAQKHCEIASLGVDTWGVDFALLDANDELLGNPRHYRDSRTEGMLEAAFLRVPRPEIFERTGIQFMRLNSLYQLLAMKLAHSSQLEAARTFLTIPDLFNFWLTGRKVNEFTNATTTQCYDPRTRDWAKPMLQQLGLPTAIFGELIAPGTPLGELLPSLAEECGVRTQVVAPACHDTGSAAVAVPASDDSFVYLSSGTWSLMGIEVKEPIINAQTLALNFTNEGGVCGTIRLLKNIMGLWLVQECRRAWIRAGRDFSYDELSRLAAQAPPLVSLIDPDDATFIAPADMPAAIAAFCHRTNQPVPDSPGALVRCALESLAMKYRWVLERLDELAGRRHKAIHIVGGGSQNCLLNQFTADACGRRVMAGPVEATAIGNVLMQALALGFVASLSEARAVVRRSFDVTTIEPTLSSNWDDAYGRWLELIAH